MSVKYHCMIERGQDAVRASKTDFKPRQECLVSIVFFLSKMVGIIIESCELPPTAPITDPPAGWFFYARFLCQQNSLSYLLAVAFPRIL